MTRLSLRAIHHRFVFFGLVLLLAACSGATPRTPDTYYDFSLALPPLAQPTAAAPIRYCFHRRSPVDNPNKLPLESVSSERKLPGAPSRPQSPS